MLARRAHEDTRIGEYSVPRGAEVVLWIYHSHHDPRWFPEPHAFRPERFARDAEAKLPKLAYIPFGAGARACIGKVFAMIEGQILLATLAQRFRFELVAGTRVSLRPRVTLAPSAPIRMTLRARRRPS
jgi:cytochrome P450